MSFFAALTLSISLASTPIQYTRHDAERLALNNLGHEFIECSAFMGIVAAVILKTPGKEAVAEKYKQSSDRLSKRTLPPRSAKNSRRSKRACRCR